MAAIRDWFEKKSKRGQCSMIRLTMWNGKYKAECGYIDKDGNFESDSATFGDKPLDVQVEAAKISLERK